MKNKALVAFIVFLLTEVLLLLAASLYPLFGSAEESEGEAIRFVSLAEVFDFSPKEPSRADEAVDKLLAGGYEDVIKKERIARPGAGQDSAFSAYNHFAPTRGDTVATDTFAINRITNPAQPDGARAMDNFFGALSALAAEPGRFVRAVHYGDSQIEGDRITRFLRANLQTQFGGAGPGYAPVFEQANHHAYVSQHSENWKRYTVFKNYYAGGGYSYTGNVFRYQRTLTDEDAQILLNKKKPVEVGAWVRYKFSKYTAWTRAGLMWGNAKAPFTLTVSSGDSVLLTQEFPAAAGFQLTYLDLPPHAYNTETTLQFDFQSVVGPDIYGFTFDSPYGVAVDNTGLRGHSGDGLRRINSNFLATQLNMMGTKLVLLQYGGNVVPYEIKDLGWLEGSIYNMLIKYKRAVPGASIVLMGVSDAARKVEGKVQSYPSVVKIRGAQMRAAQRAGVAYWDLYSAMGGRNSIVSWAHRQPALAAKDYAHFSYYGQKLVAKMFYSALMKEYNAYLRNYAPAAPENGQDQNSEEEIRFQPAEEETPDAPPAFQSGAAAPATASRTESRRGNSVEIE